MQNLTIHNPHFITYADTLFAIDVLGGVDLQQVERMICTLRITHKNYPQSRMANEIGIELGNVKKRCDTVLYDEFLRPLMIIEYKAPSVTINQNTFDQITRYNMRLNVPWLIVSNGIQHYCCRVDYENGKSLFCKEIPEYDELKVES